MTIYRYENGLKFKRITPDYPELNADNWQEGLKKLCFNPYEQEMWVEVVDGDKE